MASSSRKRKRGSDETTLQLVASPQNQLGPVLASFPALQPPKSTAFSCWRRDRNAKQDEPLTSQNAIVAGETDTVEFYTAGDSEQASVGCSYYVAVHNKTNNTTVIRPAPLHILTRQVKALKNLPALEVSIDERVQLRTTLGETFGTKKAKAAIRAQERNRVDVDAMKGVAGYLQDTIMENTGSLPTLDEAKASADSSRLIPPHNAQAQRPDDVYALSDIIPDVEMNALSLSPFKSLESNQQRASLLPFSRSNWVNQHVNLLYSAPKLRKTDMKILIYIASMIAFKMASRSVNDKDALQKRLSSVPPIILDSLLSRFTETTRNTNSVQVTTQSETMLLTHMFALCLRIDDFATDTELIAHDLGMPTNRVNTLFKSLGCKVEKLDQKELKRLGLPDSATATKRAILRVPVEFPQSRPKRARR